MHTSTGCSTALALLLPEAPPLNAQNREGVMGDLVRDVAALETEFASVAGGRVIEDCAQLTPRHTPC